MRLIIGAHRKHVLTVGAKLRFERDNLPLEDQPGVAAQRLRCAQRNLERFANIEIRMIHPNQFGVVDAERRHRRQVERQIDDRFFQIGFDLGIRGPVELNRNRGQKG